MNQSIKKLSPFVLGITFCAYQTIQIPIAQAASLALGSDPAATETAVPTATAGCSNSAPGAGLSLNSGASSELHSQDNLALFPGAPAVVASDFSTAAPEGSTSTLIAQLSPDDCCEVGGTATCEVAGLPPTGGGLLASPLLGLLGGLPLAALPFIGGSDPKPVPLSESSTAGLVAGFGLVGLWFSRRYRQDDAE